MSTPMRTAQDQDLLLDVRHLSVDVAGARGTTRLVNDVSFTVRRGEAVALVGEYVVRTYREVQGRPSWVVRRSIHADEAAGTSSRAA